MSKRKTYAPRKNTAVIYARFSCSKQSEMSIDDQIRVCREWCDRNGYAVVATYSDYAISGRTDERPDFQRMIANAGEAEVVVVYMMDRFSRDEYDAPVYKKRLRDHGARVVSATETMPDGPESILMEKLYEGLAAVESAHIGQRTKRGMEGRALKCQHNGVRVFGYDVGEDGRYVINEEEAEVVREVFSRRAAGEACNHIATDIAKRGYLTYAGNPVGYMWVYNMLRCEKYTGVYIFGDIRKEGGMPKIIDRDEWERVQGVVGKKQRKKELWRDYPLSGKTICMACGHDMVGTCGHNRYGKRYDYYRCGRRCGSKGVRADWLENSITDALRAMLSDREHTLDIARAVAAYATDERAEMAIEAAKRRQREAEQGMRNLTNAVAQGMPWELAKEKLDQLNIQAAAAAAEVAALENAEQFSVEDFADFLQYAQGFDDETLLDAFVGQVLVGDDEVIVSLNYDKNCDGATKECEPARIKLEQVRTDLVWLPAVKLPHTKEVSFAAYAGTLCLRLPRAA